MFITRKRLSRRAMLRGLGTAVALPFLDAMHPAFGRVAALNGAAPTRMAFVCAPNGIARWSDWLPLEEGPLTGLARIMKPLEPFRDEFTVLTGLAQKNGIKLEPEQHADHARALSSYLTGVRCRPTLGADILNGISVDQVAAQKIGNQTRFASIELGIEDGRQVGWCDIGYSCAYSNNLSWRTPTVPNPPEVNPRLVFERLFGAPGNDPESRAERLRINQSILDLVQEETARLTGKVGRKDQAKLDEYLTAVREIEQRIQKADEDAIDLNPAMERPSGIPAEYAEHCKLMLDLMAVAFQTNSTRIATFLMAREQSEHCYRELGHTEGHHPMTHHRGDEVKIEKVAEINCFHFQIFAHFIQRLRSVEDGDGTLLDHTMLLYGSSLGDGDKHEHDNLPTLIAAKAFDIPPGRHIRFEKDTPMNNLFLLMLDRMGAGVEQFGDSTGRLQL